MMRRFGRGGEDTEETVADGKRSVTSRACGPIARGRPASSPGVRGWRPGRAAEEPRCVAVPRVDPRRSGFRARVR